MIWLAFFGGLSLGACLGVVVAAVLMLNRRLANVPQDWLAEGGARPER